MKTAIAYTRVSTTSQADEGVSLEAQEAKIQAWCNLHDYVLARTFIDSGISGQRADNRPELQAALTACPKGGVLVVYSLSRLARSTADTLAIADQLHKNDVDLVSLSENIDTTSAAGKMLFRMLAVLAEFERDQISERTSSALQHKKTRGELVGSVPYGYTLAVDGVKLEYNSKEQAVLRLVKELRGSGLSLRKIAARLASEGHKPRGKAWYASTVSNILKGSVRSQFM